MSASAKVCPCGCGRQIRADLLVCPPGWRLLPEPMRTEIVVAQTARRDGIRDSIVRHRAAVQAARRWWTTFRACAEESSTSAAPDTQEYQVAHCDGCKAPIIWAITARGDKVCVDAEPVAVNGGQGDTTLVGRGPGCPPLARIAANPASLFGASAVYRRHIHTCPYAERYRAAARSNGTRTNRRRREHA